MRRQGGIVLAAWLFGGPAGLTRAGRAQARAARPPAGTASPVALSDGGLGGHKQLKDAPSDPAWPSAPAPAQPADSRSPGPLVWGVFGLRGFALGQQAAPN